MDQQTKHNNKDGMNGDCMEGTSSQPGQDVATPGGGGEEGRDSSTPPTPTQSDPGEGTASSSSSASSAGGSREGSSAPSKASTPALPHVHYTRDELYELKDCPLSLEWPSALDPAHNKGPGRWDPERWMRSIHDDRRPGSGGQQQPPAPSNTRIDRPPDLELKRSRDPRERVKQEEQDGLILSPQRRSFSTGCHGLQQPAPTNRPDSPAERAPQTHREIPTRRIGSGRISRRMEDLEPPTAGDRREISGRRDRDLERNLDRNLDRNIERGNIERNLDRGNDQQRDARDWRSKNDARFDRDDRYDNRRRFFEDEEEKRIKRREEHRMPERGRKYSAREEEAPEWFTEGPTSQNEFIELVGFDDIPEEGNNGNKPSKRERRRSKRDKDGGSRKSSRSSTPVLVDGSQNKQDMDVAQIGEQPQRQQQDEEHQQRQPTQPTVIEPVNDQPQRGFNIDDFLGDIIGFPGGTEEIVGPSVESSSSSKLRQFFQRGESPTFSQNFVASLQNSRRSSIDLPPHLNNMLSGLDSSRFFAPISPADKTGGASIVDLLQQAGGNIGGPENMGPPPMRQPPQLPRSQPPSIKALMLDGKGQSLEEVEAGLQRNMRRGIGQHNHQQPPPPQIQYPQNNHQQNKTHSAFNDFLSQVSTQGGSGVASHPQGHNNRHNKENVLMKLLNGGMKDNHMVKPSPMQVQPAIPNAPTENDLIAMLMKGNNVPAPQQQGQVPPRSMPPPAIPNLNVPPPNLIPPHSQPPPPVHNMGPQIGNQGGPPQHREDIVLKLLQAQQQMQHQQQQQTQQQQQQKRQQLLQQALQQGGGQASSAGHLDPIQQLMGGIGRMSVSPSPQPQDRDTFVRDAIQRPDVQNLLQQVASGQVTAGQLYSQLGSGALNKSQSDAVTTVLRFLKRGRDNITPMVGRDTRPMSSLSPTPQAVVAGGLTLGGGPSISPRVVSPNPDTSNMLNPHMLQQHQSRISPLMFAGGSGISVGPNGPRRTPSHQELVAHTQSIMQKALLKQELEKAKEKHRKREAECAKSPNPSMPPGQGSCIPKGPQDGSPNKTGVKSQSPLAFTPTSVMRKMTADKDRHDRSDKPDSPVTDGLKEIDRVRDGTQQNQQPPHQQQHQQHQQQQDFLLGLSRGGKSEKRDIRSGSSPLPGHMMIGNRPTGPGIINFNNPNQRPQQPPMPQNMGNIRTQQQNLNNLRALHVAQQQAMLTQQLMRNGGMNGSNPAAGGPGAAPGNLGGAPHHRIPNANPPGPLHQLLLNNNSQSSMHHHNKPDGLRVSLMGLGSGSHRSSPVNNLAQFFGRDILSQAGGLPELPGGKVLSLEEVERLQQQAVPN